MGIVYHDSNRTFKLDTPSSTYIIALFGEENMVAHAYYGKKLNDHNVTYLLQGGEIPFSPERLNRDRSMFLEGFPQEYPTHGVGDFRESCLQVKSAGGHAVCSIVYRSHSLYPGKPKLEGLPATFGNEEECTTLELECCDPVLNLQITLLYTVFEKLDAITRSVRIKNLAAEPITLTKVLSASLDLPNRDYDMITLHGGWAKERHVQRNPITYGKQCASSVRGESSHHEHPFLAVLGKSTTEDTGDIYGIHFVYSGNFIAQAELTQHDSVRSVIGIHPVDFSWRLDQGEVFTAPEAVLVYSCEGIGGMTRTFHDLYRNHLIRGTHKDKKRPILINNWEATYFDFDTDKLISIAKEASSLGIEMLVMDDGWFGKRNDDNSSLGDWDVNEQKLKGGLKTLVEEVNKLGMEFGIWFEPEMISPDSDLYRAHPDWAIQVPGRTACRSRNQYVLDLSRREVLEHMYESVSKILKSANITYVKWDMNRQLTDLGSYGLDSERQGELSHRYTLAVYELQERLITDFPNLLLENCSGGGGRFDPGMLYYSPQIWCSDDTDAIERLTIQQGTSMIYPLSTIGAHVSDCPNHMVGRSTPFETRGYVALAGTFGYELDVTKIPQADRDLIPAQVEMYHKYNDLIRTGDYYRIENYADNHQFDCWQVVSKDKKESLVTCIQVLSRPSSQCRRIYCKGLDADRRYRVEDTDECYTGSVLMSAGIPVKGLRGDYTGRLIHLVAEEE